MSVPTQSVNELGRYNIPFGMVEGDESGGDNIGSA